LSSKNIITNMEQLFYYSKSANKPAGKGTNEQSLNYNIYDELNKIKDWRKILSNLYNNEFTYDNKIYNSVEHAFQAKKIEIVNKEKALWFCKNSGNTIGISDGIIARKNRKIVILTNEELQKWNDIKEKIMDDILLAKFTQIPIAKQVLLLTHDAILLHGTRGNPIKRQYNLENIRKKLKISNI
jgi:predicted NAD-dependent protein-ADP-ribosyltransferase YbiA (DUF1768 family)